MAALDTIAHELDALQTEEERVLEWRRSSLMAAGYDLRHAEGRQDHRELIRTATELGPAVRGEAEPGHHAQRNEGPRGVNRGLHRSPAGA